RGALADEARATSPDAGAGTASPTAAVPPADSLASSAGGAGFDTAWQRDSAALSALLADSLSPAAPAPPAGSRAPRGMRRRRVTPAAGRDSGSAAMSPETAEREALREEIAVRMARLDSLQRRLRELEQPAFVGAPNVRDERDAIRLEIELRRRRLDSLTRRTEGSREERREGAREETPARGDPGGDS
ncbi:MAG TPA: hypothetical protein VFS05_10935, partial [Gemmatimonadaceae bacterium]|nr:hypothetical protein [Gemmatimonadaceae bacterium]